ncbi:methyltransferase domain-containing protein [Rhodopila sp.]|uniref:class I SAM-dependent methyltransferase n=1 Tax=Rhodopila sp. TaxID=2480087 RepID=UPI003D11CD21
MIEAIEWPAAAASFTALAVCPNCGNVESKQFILRAPWPHATTADGRVGLLRCPACGCGFVYPAKTADYAAEQADGGSGLAFYLQQGAGLSGIASNVAALDRPAGTRLLEVGCGFGFGLDFARRALGWNVVGLDPSPFAAAGRACLDLPIESRYLVIDDPALGDRFDVVMASEVIEHVASPPAFARTLRSALRDGGSLVLTTPDVEAVSPATPRGILVPLLSIGYHLVLQSASSLAGILHDAGFVDVDVRRVGGGQLIAQCRRGPLPQGSFATMTNYPGAANPGFRDQYRRYLRDAAEAADTDSDLWFGLTARTYREAVNAADRPAADALWMAFSTACRRRFGSHPEAATNSVADTAAESLDSLVVREPLCLGPVLLHRAFHRLLAGERRSAVGDVLQRAADACDRLRRSLQRIGSDDGDAEDVGWVAGAEALLCAAEGGAKNLPERFDALGASPADAIARRDGQPLRTEQYRRRIFVSLINAAQLDEADRLADVVQAVEARATVPGILLADDELDALFCAAVRELQRREGGAARALDLLRQLRAACDRACAAGRGGSAVSLMPLARDREILALKVLGRKQEAKALRRSSPAANVGSRIW